jgi:tetratricopeptide (TPR) repeat protein
MRQVLLFAPDHPVATSNLAAFMRISGQSDVAETLLHRQLTQKAGDIGARLNLAADLLQEERAADALALQDEGGTPGRDLRAVRHWHLQKSLALLQLRRFEEARAVLDALAALGPIPAEIAPLWYWRQALLALGEGDVGAAREAAAQMEAALDAMGPDAVPEHQIMAHYDLAKF